MNGSTEPFAGGWPKLNRERGELIAKSIDCVLSLEESGRLQYLSGYADGRIEALHPRELPQAQECPNCANPPHEGPCRRKRVAEPLAPLSDERVRELTQLTPNGPEVVAMAQEVERSRKRAAIRAEDEPERAAWEALVAYAQTGGKDSPLFIYQITTHYLRMQVACEKAEEDAERSRVRIAALEDAITEAGFFILAGKTASAMKRLSEVMGPDALRRQGI